MSKWQEEIPDRPGLYWVVDDTDGVPYFTEHGRFGVVEVSAYEVSTYEGESLCFTVPGHHGYTTAEELRGYRNDMGTKLLFWSTPISMENVPPLPEGFRHV